MFVSEVLYNWTYSKALSELIFLKFYYQDLQAPLHTLLLFLYFNSLESFLYSTNLLIYCN